MPVFSGFCAVGLLDGLHEDTGADAQGVGDLEEGLKSGLPLTPLDGTQVGAPDAGQPADQLLGHFLLLPDALNGDSDNDGIQHMITSLTN